MGVISETGLNCESIDGRYNKGLIECTSERDTHVNKGETLWSGVKTAHDSRFTSVSNRSMTLDGEVTPIDG